MPSGDQCNKNIGWTLKHTDIQELKIISLTLEKLLRNFPRLGGYTQRVRPGAHPVLYQQGTVDNHHEHRRTSFKYHKV